MSLVIRRRTFVRLLSFGALALLLKLILGSPSHSTAVSSFYGPVDPKEIRKQNVLDLVRGSDKQLDARTHEFLQVRMGRDERPDLFADVIDSGVQDYWERFQRP